MIYNSNLRRNTLIILFVSLFLLSCTKDSDLFADLVLANNNEESVDEETENDTSINPNKVVGTYHPTSAADITNASNVNMKAVITNSFDCNGCTFAENQTIEPAGGSISGTNINLNGVYIENNNQQAFSPEATFSEIYENSKLSPDTFGGFANDATDDSDAIDALINNCAFATAVLNGTYVKNAPSVYTRAGRINWDMNGAKVEITSASNFNLTKVSVDAVFDITNLSPTIYNGEFDGNDIYGRLFYLRGQPSFSFNNLWVHDLYTPSPIRCIAFRFSINVENSGFVSGEFRNNLMEDIVAGGDGIFNNTDGIAKAWWYTMSGVIGSSTYNVTHENNVVRNIIGDDAEAFYAIQGGGTHINNGSWLLDNEDYRNSTRRAVKFCISNVTIQNSYFEEMEDILFSSAQQVGSMVDFFSTQSVNLIENITITNNVITSRPGSIAHYDLLSLTEVNNATVTGNTISMSNLENYSGLRLGSNTSSYNGVLSNISVSGNNFENCGVGLLNRYAPVGQLSIDDNDFLYTYNTSDNWGANQAAVRTLSTSGSKGNIDFTNNRIIVNSANNTNLFNGLMYSHGANIVNMNFTDVTITYQNSTVVRPFGYMLGNFDSTNLIENCSLKGDTGLSAVEVLGSAQSVKVVNSLDDNGNKITIL